MNGLGIVGGHRNAWNAVAVAINGLSAIIDLAQSHVVSIFGDVSAATNLDVLITQGSTFPPPDAEFTVHSTIVLGAAGNFHQLVNLGVRFIRLRSSAAVTISATIAGKP